MIIVAIFVDILDPFGSVALKQLVQMRPLFEVFIKLREREDVRGETEKQKERRRGGGHIPEDPA